jgi:hypothetical protein
VLLPPKYTDRSPDMNPLLSITKQTLRSLVALALVAAALAVAPAHATSNGDFAVEPWGDPADESVTESTRSSFFYPLAAGQDVQDWVAVANFSDTPQTFVLFGADAINTETGTFTVKQYGEDMTDVGLWIDVPNAEITVEPGERLVVPFTVTIPDNATPGEHVGGVVALGQDLIDITDEDGNVGVQIQSSIAVPVFVQIAGETRAEMAVRDISVEPIESGHSIEYTVVNTGNIRLSPEAVVTFTGLMNRFHGRLTPQSLTGLLPGESTTFTQAWDGAPIVDRITATVVASQGVISTEASVGFWAISSWAYLALVPVAALLLWWAVAAWRPRRGTDDTPPSTEQREPVEV